MINDDTRGPAINFSYKWTSHSVSKSLQSSPVINVVNVPRYYQGYVYGFKQPVCCVSLFLSTIKKEQCEQLQAALAHYFSEYPFSTQAFKTNKEVVNSFAEAAALLQKSAGMPIFDAVRVESIDEQEFRLWIPMLFDHCVQDALTYLLKVYNYHLQPHMPVNPTFIKEHEKLLQILKLHAPQGSNTLLFLQAAHGNNIPWTHLALNNFLYGYGNHSHWLDSSFTDMTPHTTAALAANKRAMNYFLAQQGLPVVEQDVVSEQDVIQKAKAIGYPVVLKPIDGHGGKGVFPHLNNANDVQQAYRLTRATTQTVLIEKHISGKDYRLVVFQGKLLWAIERIPAGVYGDGVNSIAQLIEINNQHHRAVYPLLHIKVTADVIEYLHEQDLELTSVIEKDCFIPLNRSANISAGGTPVGVFDKVHPDNVNLMEMIATLLRVDLAGIDFITPDISRSYLEVGGSIIEVNVQPQLGRITTSHIYAAILKRLLPERGRIPIYVIYADEIEPALLQQIKSELPSSTAISMVMNNAIYLDNKLLLHTENLYVAGKHVLLRNDITALIYCIRDENDILQFGLPFDSCTKLFVQQPKLEKNVITKHTLLTACHEHYAFIPAYNLAKKDC